MSNLHPKYLQKSHNDANKTIVVLWLVFLEFVKSEIRVVLLMGVFNSRHESNEEVIKVYDTCKKDVGLYFHDNFLFMANVHKFQYVVIFLPLTTSQPMNFVLRNPVSNYKWVYQQM